LRISRISALVLRIDAIAHIEKNIVCDAVLVMDSDGKETPAGVLQLLEATQIAEAPRASLRAADPNLSGIGPLSVL